MVSVCVFLYIIQVPYSSRKSSFMKLFGSTSLIFFAGFPATIILGGISFVTTAPAAIIASCPISTPGQIVAPPPIAQPKRNFAPLMVDGT